MAARLYPGQAEALAVGPAALPEAPVAVQAVSQEAVAARAAGELEVARVA